MNIYYTSQFTTCIELRLYSSPVVTVNIGNDARKWFSVSSMAAFMSAVHLKQASKEHDFRRRIFELLGQGWQEWEHHLGGGQFQLIRTLGPMHLNV